MSAARSGNVSLFEMDQEWAALMYTMANGEELTPEQAAMLVANETDWENKMVNYWRMMKNFEAQAVAVSAVLDQLQAKLESWEKLKESMRMRMEHSMRLRGVTKMETAFFRAAIRKASVRPVVVTAEDQLPAEYVRETVVKSIDKKGIAAAIKAGKEVPGATLAEPVEWFDLK